MIQFLWPTLETWATAHAPVPSMLDKDNHMFRLTPYLLVLLLGLIGPVTLRAESLTIDLEAQAAKETRKARAETVASAERQPRAILMAKAGTPVTVKWTLHNTDTTATVNDVLVHFVAVKIDKPDQQDVPKLTKDVLAESALTMDFKPGDKSEGEVTFSVARPGCYLLRVETKGAPGKDGREPFAALDLVIR